MRLRTRWMLAISVCCSLTFTILADDLKNTSDKADSTTTTVFSSSTSPSSEPPTTMLEANSTTNSKDSESSTTTIVPVSPSSETKNVSF
ncbi:hypothetical protein WR25_16198 [Diploscapter pachys]|uniref:Uncharacterized protein n=1 Tax=Diploscapter pachys TaxID=2018661 RepID=A0A2A2LIG5_9BILA|nr:hypothetical protein WR25_16198 [Diploscapter pachys]